MSHEGTIEDLKTQLSNMEQKARLLEEDKAALENSNSSTSETHLARINALEQVCEAAECQEGSNLPLKQWPV